MKITVEVADSTDDYLKHWKKAMADVHWFKNPSLFDYHPKEMAEEIAREFNKPECIHLQAKAEKSKETLGVLKVKIQEGFAMLGRWEPAVTSGHQDRGVGEALLEEAFSQLQKRRVSKTKCILKFPFKQPEKAHWHIGLYQKLGFVLARPIGVLLLTDLSNAKANAPAISNLRIVDGNQFSLEELADFTQRAFMSTPEDRAVHQSDQSVSNRENVLKVLEAIKTGKFGLSPPEPWQMAKLNNDIAGFIIGFIPTEFKYRPPHGVIGELGVFPEFRRRGIAATLVANIFKCFKRHGCMYSLVGTPNANTSGINLYRRMGFTPAFEQMDFQKIL
jgi:ribosomal protein S18 acetylase RimI-like enzyme